MPALPMNNSISALRKKTTQPHRPAQPLVTHLVRKLLSAWIPVVLAAPCVGFTGVMVTDAPSNPHGKYTATRSLDETAAQPNKCAGVNGCSVSVFAMSDMWEEWEHAGYTTADNDTQWVACLQNPSAETLGDVAKCLQQKNIPTTLTVVDYLPEEFEVKDHSLACLAYRSGWGYNATKGRIHCAPLGGALSTCKFDAPSLNGAFRGYGGVNIREEVDLGAVNMKCDADLTIIAVAGGSDGGPIQMVQGNNRAPTNVATVDLGAGEGKALTIKAKQGVNTRINVKAIVSGNYEVGEVRGTGTITISAP